METLLQYVRNDQLPKKVGFFSFRCDYSQSFTTVLIYY